MVRLALTILMSPLGTRLRMLASGFVTALQRDLHVANRRVRHRHATDRSTAHPGGSG